MSRSSKLELVVDETNSKTEQYVGSMDWGTIFVDEEGDYCMRVYTDTQTACSMSRKISGSIIGISAVVHDNERYPIVFGAKLVIPKQ
jgi:hypothetical protein